MGLNVNPRGRPPRQLEWTVSGAVVVADPGDDGRILSGDNLIRATDDGPGTSIRVGLDPTQALENGMITYSGGVFYWIPIVFVTSGELGGIAEGTPANMSITFPVSPTLIIDEMPSAVSEPFELMAVRKYHNLSAASTVRLQGSVVQAVSGGKVAMQGSLDGGFTWDYLDGTGGPNFTTSIINYPSLGDWVFLDPTYKVNNVLLRPVIADGDDASPVEFGTIYLDVVSSESPPTGEEGSPPDLPEDEGNLIHDLNSLTIALSNGAGVSSWNDDSVSAQDAATFAGSSAPTYLSTGWDGVLPCVEFGGGTQGLRVDGQVTGETFTTYIVATACVAAGFAPFWDGQDGYPFGKGVYFGNGTVPTSLGAHVNTTIWGNTFVWTADDFDKTVPHIYRFTFSRPLGLFKVFVDGVEKIANGCNPQITTSTHIYMGYYGAPGNVLAMKIGREVTYDRHQFGSGLTSVETALKAVWGTP